MQVRRGLLARHLPHDPKAATTTTRRHRTQLVEQHAQHLRRRRVLIDRPRVVQDPRHSQRRLSKPGPRLRGQTVGLSQDSLLDGARAGAIARFVNIIGHHRTASPQLVDTLVDTRGLRAIITPATF